MCESPLAGFELPRQRQICKLSVIRHLNGGTVIRTCRIFFNAFPGKVPGSALAHGAGHVG